MSTTQPPTEQPIVVTAATVLLCVNLAVSIFAIFWALAHEGSPRSSPFLLLFTAWLISRINAGRNWARITLLVLFLFGIIVLILAALLKPFIPSGFFILHTALETVALILLFSRGAGPWYHPAPKPNPALEPTFAAPSISDTLDNPKANDFSAPASGGGGSALDH